MTVPTLEKTWQFNVNNAMTAQGTAKLNNARILRLVKNAMIGFASSPWSLRYCCGGGVAGTAGDGVDRWTADTDLVWVLTSGAHSWIILRQTGIATNFELCIDLLVNYSVAATNGYQLVFIISPAAGFTGGSTTARPTATDEIIKHASGYQWTSVTTDVAQRWSVMQSTDGQCTNFFSATGGVINTFWKFDKPADPSTGWTNPSNTFTSVGVVSSSVVTSYTGRMMYGSTVGNTAMGTEAMGSVIATNDTTGAASQVNDISGDWPMFPVGLSCNTGGVKGRHGRLYDTWGGSVSIAVGDSYPVATTDFIQIGALILPWNGGAINLS